MAKQPIIINVTTEKPIVEITNFVPSPTGSFGSALTAIQSDTAVSSSHAVQSNFAISASHALRVSTASFALVAQDALGGSGNFTGSYTGTFKGDGTGITGIVAQSTQSTADTASYMAGANVDGQVESASLAQIALLAITASFVESASFATRTISASHALRADNADRADVVAFDNVTGKPTLVSESIQVDHNDTTNFEAGLHFSQAAIVQVGNVALGNVKAILPAGTVTSSTQINDQLDLVGVSGSFTGSFIGEVSAASASLAETASYVAGADVDGPVASALSASDVAYNDVRDKPTLISSSAQFDADDDFIVGQIDAVGVSGSFIGTGQGITGIVLADSATLALGVSGTDVIGPVDNADTASYVAGGNVDGAVDLLDGEATGTLTGSFIGGINLTDTSDMSGSTFAHQVGALIGQSSAFTISLDDNQIQQFAISASLEFDVEGGRVGGIYNIHFINSGAFDVTWPADMKYNSGSAITTSIASGALDIYTMTRLPDSTYYTTIFGQFIS